MNHRPNGFFENLRLVLFSGFIGGMAEVIWILLYSQLSGADPTLIGSEITRSFFHSCNIGLGTALFGVLIHFVLAFIVSLFFITVIMPLFNLTHNKKRTIVMGLLYLTAIWNLNFLILLPIVNNIFVHLFPFVVTLFSKLLFGYSMSLYISRRIQASSLRQGHIIR